MQNSSRVGMSANPARASHFVATYLAGKTDWTIYYVNPRETEILGGIIQSRGCTPVQVPVMHRLAERQQQGDRNGPPDDAKGRQNRH